MQGFFSVVLYRLLQFTRKIHNIWLLDLLLCCPSTQFQFEGPVCQKVTIILQAISLKLIQTRKHNIATPNSECRDSSALCYIDCCNLPGTSTTYGCLICCCAALQHNFISFGRSSLPGYCRKVTIILQAISLKLI